jgi:signal transduction histidine kinase
MRHSLRLRVFLTMAAVLAVALAALVWFASRTARTEFTRAVSASVAARDARLGDWLTGSYVREGTWSGVQPLVEQMGQVAGERIVVLGPAGTVVADSSGAPGDPARPLPTGVPLRRIPLRGEAVGKIQLIVTADDNPAAAPADVLVAVPPGAVPALPALPSTSVVGSDGLFIAAAPGQDFGRSVNRSLLWAAGLAGLAAVVLTYLLSRRILRPVEALTAAARRMEAGDLTTRVDVGAPDELGALAHAFNAMADGLERQEHLRRTMVTDVSHELRTPLSNIRGYLEALREGVLPVSPAVLDSLHEEALLLGRLVDDLQDLALAEAGRLRLEIQRLDLSAAIAGSLMAASPAADARGVALGSALPVDLPSVDADPERLGQVLRNLVANAIAHTPRGGTVTVSAQADADGGTVTVTVDDTGPGISPEHLPHVFERFYRADPARARATGGAGLGLAITRQIVRAHGGTAWAENRPEGGARVAFRLPLVARVS